MNFKQIESLKFALLNLARQGSRMQIPSCGVSGRIVGIGFRPYWTEPYDSKIDRLEINFQDDRGRILPFYFNNVIGYDVISNDGRGYDTMRNASIDIVVYSAEKGRNGEPVEKVRLNVFPIDDKK